jgi:hypothetical protein
MSFILDTSAPTTTATLVGGVKCTGDSAIYCTAPTGIKLSDSHDSQAGLGAYRTQWTTPFTSTTSSPSWIAVNPPSTPLPSHLPTSNHTTPATSHTLYYQTKDKVGNASAVGSINYYVNDAPSITLGSADHDIVVTPFTPLVFVGTITDSDLAQTQIVTLTIDGIDYQSQAYQALGGETAWSLVVNASALEDLSAHQLTNLPLKVTDSAGASSTIT